jgi:hypothetical protein
LFQEWRALVYADGVVQKILHRNDERLLGL